MWSDCREGKEGSEGVISALLGRPSGGAATPDLGQFGDPPLQSLELLGDPIPPGHRPPGAIMAIAPVALDLPLEGLVGGAQFLPEPSGLRE